MGSQRLVDVVDPVLEHGECLGQLGQHLRVRPHEFDAVAEGRVLGERLVGERSDEHLHEGTFPLGHGVEVGRWAGHEPLIGREAFGVVGVQQTTNGIGGRGS